MFAVSTLANGYWSYMNMRILQLCHYHKVHQHSKSQALVTSSSTDASKRKNHYHHRRAAGDAVPGEGLESRLRELSRTLTALSSASPSATAPRPSVRLCRSNCSRSRRCRNSRSFVFCSRSRTNSSVSCLIYST